jgi:hypothetical protein
MVNAIHVDRYAVVVIDLRHAPFYATRRFCRGIKRELDAERSDTRDIETALKGLRLTQRPVMLTPPKVPALRAPPPRPLRAPTL